MTEETNQTTANGDSLIDVEATIPLRGATSELLHHVLIRNYGRNIRT